MKWRLFLLATIGGACLVPLSTTPAGFSCESQGDCGAGFECLGGLCRAAIDKPSPQTVGLPPGTAVNVHHGANLSISDSGTYENFSATTVSIGASNVTIRRCRVFGLERWNGAITVSSTATNVVIEDCDIGPDAGHFDSPAVHGRSFTARRNWVHGFSDAFVGDTRLVIESNYFATMAPGDARRLMVARGSIVEGLVVRGNVCDLGETGYSCLDINRDPPAFGVETSFIEHNWINTGNYTLRINGLRSGTDGGAAVVLRGNRFGPHKQYGYLYGSDAWIASEDNFDVGTQMFVDLSNKP